MSVSSSDSPRAPSRAALLPGLVLAVGVMLVAREGAGLLGEGFMRLRGAASGQTNPISGMSVAIVLGMLLANTVGVGERFGPGLQAAIRLVLRLGIVLVGLKMSFYDVVALGATGVPAVAVGMACTMAVAIWLARRLGVSSRLGILAAASTAVCGVTATVAIAPAIEADDQEVAYTVANVTLFGLLAMLVYPYVAHSLFGGVSGSAGLFLGMGIHDTSQVMGAALSYREIFGDELAMKVATVAKLTRNVFLVVAVPLLTWLHSGRGSGGRRPGISKLLPTFVLGFLAMAVLRSLGDAGLRGPGHLAFGTWDREAWASLTKLLGGDVSTAALGTAMAAVGLTTRLSILRGIGPGPLYLGAGSAIFGGLVALGMAASVGPFIGR